MVVAGGGGGGGGTTPSGGQGGGGAGGFREGRNVPIDNFTASPLVANAPTNAVTVTAQAYPITVGGGGAGGGPQSRCGLDTGGTNGKFNFFNNNISGGGGGGTSDPAGVTPTWSSRRFWRRHSLWTISYYTYNSWCW